MVSYTNWSKCGLIIVRAKGYAALLFSIKLYSVSSMRIASIASMRRFCLDATLKSLVDWKEISEILISSFYLRLD